MRELERRLRRAVNPLSTGLSRWWCGVGRRRMPRPAHAPARPATPRPARSDGRPQAFLGVPSPGDWVAPAGKRPGWEWLPEHGAVPNLLAMPRWVRVWYRTPFLDRYAYEWMWWHGGWSVLVHGEPPSPPDGVREPRRPSPTPRSMSGIIDETSGRAIG